MSNAGEILSHATHSWNVRDIVGYECPIVEFVKRTTTQVVEEREERIYKAVLDIGICVNKEELLKALQYDRGQYEKGFYDGQQKAQRWIPCSERLPEMSGSYLCCWKEDDDPRITMSVLNFDGEGFPWERVNYHSNTRVLAWMPLPEPYREDGDNDG